VAGWGERLDRDPAPRRTRLAQSRRPAELGRAKALDEAALTRREAVRKGTVVILLIAALAATVALAALVPVGPR